MMLRILTAPALAFLLARIALVRESAPTSSVTPVSGMGKETVTIEMSVWGMPFENALYTDVYIPEFERQNPGIKISFSHFEDYGNRVLLCHAGNIAPDVIREGYESSMAWTRRGLNLPLDRFIDGPDGIDRKDFIPLLWGGLRYQGETYAVPQDINVFGLFYNKELFDRAGLAYPNANWTWRDLKNAVDRLTIDKDGDGHPEQKGIEMAWNADTFRPFAYAAGAKFWNGDRAAFDSPEAVEALKFYQSLVKSYTLTRSTEGRGALGPDKFFQNGTVAMYVDGGWMTPSISKGAPNLRFGVAPMPRGMQSCSVSGSCVWAIDRNSKHPQEAWKLLKFLSSEWALKKYWQSLWVAPPARWSALRSPEFHQVTGIAGGAPPIRTAAEFQDKCAWLPQVLEHGWTTLEYANPYTGRMMGNLNSAIDKVLIERQDPAKSLHAAVVETNRQIEDSERSGEAP